MSAVIDLNELEIAIFIAGVIPANDSILATVFEIESFVGLIESTHFSILI